MINYSIKPTVIALWLCVVSCVYIDVRAEEDVVRRPIPSMAERKEALTILEDTFAKELKSRDRTILLSLADTFRKKAAAKDIDDASRYILLSQASVLAAQSVDVPSVISDINELGHLYAIDTDQVVLEGLKKASRAAKKSTAYIPITESLMGIVQRSFAQDRFDLASAALYEAGSASRKSRDKGLRDAISALKKEFSEKSRRYKSYVSGLKALKTTPDDPMANTKAAYYLCFVKQDWAGGLDYLAKCSDEELAAVALDELLGAESAEDQLKLADGYYDVAVKKKLNKPMANVLLGKAKHYYDLVLPQITGLKKMKIEKRLEELDKFSLTLIGQSSGKVNTKGLLLHGNFDNTHTPIKNHGGKKFSYLSKGVRFGRGRTGKAAQFDKQAYLLMSEPAVGLGTTQSVTISVWFKPTKAGVIMNEMGSPNLDNPTSMRAYHCSVFEVGGDGRCVARLWQLNALELGKAKLGQWNHAVLRYDAKTTQFDGFLNKKYVLGTKRQRQGSGTSHYGFSLGDSTHVISPHGFEGALDDVLVYGRALTDKEISRL